MSDKLFNCPLCKRSGFSEPGIKNHRCPALPKITKLTSSTGNTAQYRQRLAPELVEKILRGHS